jgi:hypothetical protein
VARRAVALPVVLLVSLAIGGCVGSGSNGSTVSPPGASASPPTPVATLPATVQAPPPATPSATPPAAPSATPAPTSSSEGSVVALVVTFEAARSTGDRAAAWALLAPRSQSAIGSLSSFIRLADASVADGGTQFRVVEATQESSRFDPLAIGDNAAADLAPSLAAGRAWIVDVAHPNVRGASAASEVLAVAPGADGTWRIWIVH